jgi:HAMP domain-containing protein
VNEKQEVLKEKEDEIGRIKKEKEELVNEKQKALDEKEDEIGRIKKEKEELVNEKQKALDDKEENIIHFKEEKKQVEEKKEVKEEKNQVKEGKQEVEEENKQIQEEIEKQQKEEHVEMEGNCWSCKNSFSLKDVICSLKSTRICPECFVDYVCDNIDIDNVSILCRDNKNNNCFNNYFKHISSEVIYFQKTISFSVNNEIKGCCLVNTKYILFNFYFFLFFFIVFLILEKEKEFSLVIKIFII